MSKVRVCFLGTPEFAVASLKALLEDDHFEVVGVVTQPDRPAGRKLQLTPSPVKVLAQNHGLKVLSPESLKQNKLIVEAIETWGAEIAVVVAFGQILTEDFLKIFNFGAVNVHGSVLPRWRGAAPIQRAIQAGDRESGVTLQKVVKKLDAGDVLGIRRVSISEEMNAQELYDQLAFLGADLLRVEMMDYVRGNLGGVPQDETQVTYAKKIEKSEAQIQWSDSAQNIHNKVRAFVMGPGTFTTWSGRKLKIHKTRSAAGGSGSGGGAAAEGTVGRIVAVKPHSLEIQCGNGILEVLELQPESRNRMTVESFLKANEIKVGDSFE